ncbi:hypothetical protein LEP1GSC172_3587 [Leptospira noguchii]|uniref:Uncharacterized protein n=2 Tax=Leptospira noguchii TaxID=28182 RepID=T0FPJ0_9LEPT|nr:hypothetical protein LEP1GSC172_3587 [Leptospira noguchii]EQA71490.1 hypothetical protein LEP1GSC059_2708 [Leptospira noguchii serovar Panama str. CZ214]
MEYELGEIEPFYFSRKLNFIKTNSILLEKVIVDIRNKFFPQFFSHVECKL